MHAKPQINGNPPADFVAAGRALHDAAIDAKEAMRRHTREPHNSRNYQHLDVGDRYAIRDQDIERIRRIEAALDDMAALATEIYQAGTAAGGA